LDGIHITHCYSNTVQSVDFVQMFQSVIIF